MSRLSKALLASTAIAMTAGLAMPASAQDPADAPRVVTSGDEMKLRLYGQVSRYIGWVDDGISETFIQGENQVSSTRFGIDARGKVTNDISLRVRYEIEISSGDDINQTSDGSARSDTLNVRHTDAIFTHRRFGRFYMGHGDAASNGTSESSLAGLGSSGTSGEAFEQGADILIRAKGAAGQDLANSSVTAGSVLSDLDGASRANRVRYDLPELFGFTLGASWIGQDEYDVGLRYGATWFDTQFEAAFGYYNDSEGVDQLAGSASFLTPWGIGASASGGYASAGQGISSDVQEQAYNIFGEAFYRSDLIEMGETSFAFQYQKASNGLQNQPVAQVYTFLIEQDIDSVGMDTFVGFSYLDADGQADANGETAEYEDIVFLRTGFRARF